MFLDKTAPNYYFKSKPNKCLMTSKTSNKKLHRYLLFFLIAPIFFLIAPIFFLIAPIFFLIAPIFFLITLIVTMFFQSIVICSFFMFLQSELFVGPSTSTPNERNLSQWPSVSQPPMVVARWMSTPQLDTSRVVAILPQCQLANIIVEAFTISSTMTFDHQLWHHRKQKKTQSQPNLKPTRTRTLQQQCTCTFKFAPIQLSRDVTSGVTASEASTSLWMFRFWSITKPQSTHWQKGRLHVSTRCSNDTISCECIAWSKEI